ncbi:MAG TPA: hypothetical protein DEB67_14850, partial [Oceanicaulis sp.]|nr:hypothetical protein [Oceanicaulis sp.]
MKFALRGYRVLEALSLLVGAWLALQPAEIWSGQACPRSVTPEELSLKTEFQLALPDTQAQLWIDAYRGRTLDL